MEPFSADVPGNLGPDLERCGTCRIFRKATGAHEPRPGVSIQWLAALLAPVDESVVAGVSKISAVTAFRLAQCAWAVATRKGDPQEAGRWAACCESLCGSVVVFDRGLALVGGLLEPALHHGTACPVPVRSKATEAGRTDRLEAGIVPGRAARGRKGAGDPCARQALRHHRPKLWILRAGLPGGDQALCDLASEASEETESPNSKTTGDASFIICSMPFWMPGGRKRRKASCSVISGGTSRVFRLMSMRRSPVLGPKPERFRGANRDVCRSLLRKGLDGHPWQLWLWNVGRILTDSEGKRLAWEQGLRLCSRLGPTARPMGLLHAAWLWREGLVFPERIRPTVEEILADLESGPLWKHHFRPLLRARSWSHALEQILHTPARYFPFTYR